MQPDVAAAKTRCALWWVTIITNHFYSSRPDPWPGPDLVTTHEDANDPTKTPASTFQRGARSAATRRRARERRHSVRRRAKRET